MNIKKKKKNAETPLGCLEVNTGDISLLMTVSLVTRLQDKITTSSESGKFLL